MKPLLTVSLFFAVVYAHPAGPVPVDAAAAADEPKKQDKRGVLGLPLILSPVVLPPPIHTPIALPAPILAPHVLPAPALHAPLALPPLHSPLALPHFHDPLVLPHHTPLALPHHTLLASPPLYAPAHHTPIAYPAVAPVKTIAPPLTLPNLPLGKIW